MFPALYLIIALILSSITINSTKTENTTNLIYLTTNGVHLDIIIPTESLNTELKKELQLTPSDKFIAFGWGDEKFYIETPQFKDLTFSNGFNALFLNSPTLLHVTNYKANKKEWVLVKLTSKQFKKIIAEFNS